MAQQQPTPRICPFMSIATVGQTPSSVITNPLNQQPQGIQPVACAGLDCMIFVPLRDEKSGKLIGGNCGFMQAAMALTLIQQELTKLAARDAIPQPPPRLG